MTRTREENAADMAYEASSTAPKISADIADLLSLCRTAITERWDVHHDETIALVNRIDDVLNAFVGDDDVDC